MNSVPSRKAGFTLVELLAVVAIVGILAAIILVVVGHVRESGREVRCASNLRQIGVALTLYANDHHGVYPAAADPTNPTLYGYDYASQLIMGGYVTAGTGAFACPSDPVVLDNLMPPTPAGAAHQNEVRDYRYVSPAMDPQYKVNMRRRMSSIATPAQTAMVTEWANVISGSVVQYTIGNGVYCVDGSAITTEAGATKYSGHPNGGRNFLFFDGHVAFFQFGQWPTWKQGTPASDIFWGDAYGKIN